MSEMETVVINGKKYEVHDPDALSGVDATLSQEGKPADAAAVGAALDDKAPAGYGLGVLAATLSAIADCNEATACGLYKITGSTANNGVGVSGLMRVDGYDGANLLQTIFTTNYSQSYSVVVQRECRRGVWCELEWVNPPMVLGEEYRTTERWQGKAVYTILANIGALPNSANANATIKCTAKNVIRDAMTLQEIANGRTFTSDPTLTYYCGVNTSGTVYCNMKSTTNLSAYNGIIQLWYTKD